MSAQRDSLGVSSIVTLVLVVFFFSSLVSFAFVVTSNDSFDLRSLASIEQWRADSSDDGDPYGKDDDDQREKDEKEYERYEKEEESSRTRKTVSKETTKVVETTTSEIACEGTSSHDCFFTVNLETGEKTYSWNIYSDPDGDGIGTWTTITASESQIRANVEDSLPLGVSISNVRINDVIAFEEDLQKDGNIKLSIDYEKIAKNITSNLAEDREAPYPKAKESTGMTGQEYLELLKERQLLQLQQLQDQEPSYPEPPIALEQYRIEEQQKKESLTGYNASQIQSLEEAINLITERQRLSNAGGTKPLYSLAPLTNYSNTSISSIQSDGRPVPQPSPQTQKDTPLSISYINAYIGNVMADIHNTYSSINTNIGNKINTYTSIPYTDVGTTNFKTSPYLDPVYGIYDSAFPYFDKTYEPVVVTHTPAGFEDIIDNIYNTPFYKPGWNYLSDTEKIKIISSRIHQDIEYSSEVSDILIQQYVLQQQIDKYETMAIKGVYADLDPYQNQTGLLNLSLTELEAELNSIYAKKLTLTPYEIRQLDLSICSDFTDITTQILKDMTPKITAFSGASNNVDIPHAFTVVEINNELQILDTTWNTGLVPLQFYLDKTKIKPEELYIYQGYSTNDVTQEQFNLLIAKSLESDLTLTDKILQELKFQTKFPDIQDLSDYVKYKYILNIAQQ